MQPTQATPAPPDGIVRRDVLRTRAGQTAMQHDFVADEVPVQFRVDADSFAVMMATPADIDDFALGFCLGEGLIEHASQLRGCSHRPTLEGIEVQLQLDAPAAERARLRRQSISGRSGCGICGSESLDVALRAPPRVQGLAQLHSAALHRALDVLARLQPLNRLCGALHAAAFVSTEGEVLLLREDIGRHNALDKLVGAVLRGGHDAATGFVLMSSRASVELVAKAARAGVGLLATISGPTSLAIAFAESAGITLVGFCRADGHAVYTHRQRLVESDPQ
jgi:FdhD protein